MFDYNMARRILSRTAININCSTLSATNKSFGNNYARKVHTKTVSVKEIQIPVQWGHISGKLWGNENQQPILALHGWQDNAGTWDPLAPILAKHRPILAIDFPGHGLTSWIPPGMQYHSWDFQHIILYIKDYFKWNKVSVLGHSMGGTAGLRFASVFPDYVDFYIAIDNIFTDDYDMDQVVDNLPKVIRRMRKDHSPLDQDPPTYEIEELTRLWHLGSNKSVTLESVQHLINRGTKESTRSPGKYCFSRDPRLKTLFFHPESKQFVATLVKRLKCPTLYIKAADSPYVRDKLSIDILEFLAQNNEKFECHFVPGTHYVHLNNPNIIIPLIMTFLQKHNLLH